MNTFLRRLEILNYLRQQNKALTTEQIISHLTHAGHIEERPAQPKSVFRLIQRDLKFLLGDKLDEEAEDNSITGDRKEHLAYSEYEDYDNHFGLTLEKGSGKSQLWKLEPYSLLEFNFERMPALMALALTLNEKHLKQVMPSEIRSELKQQFSKAQEKLIKSDQKLTTQHYQRLTNSVEFFQRGQQLQAAEFNPEILDSIYRAILKGKQISIHYDRKGLSKEYLLDPYGVVFMLPKLYLVAKKHSHNEENFRSFLIHKIQNVVIENQSNRVPNDFDLKRYLSEGHMDVLLNHDKQGYTLTLALSAKASSLIDDLQENPISPDQTLFQLDSETWNLTATVKRTIQLRNWLLALGSDAKVLSPDIIRQDILDSVSAIQSSYL